MSELALLTVEVSVASIAILALVAAFLYFVFSEVRASRAELQERLTTRQKARTIDKMETWDLTYDESVELRDILHPRQLKPMRR